LGPEERERQQPIFVARAATIAVEIWIKTEIRNEDPNFSD
jgi:hypothetical protein